MLLGIVLVHVVGMKGMSQVAGDAEGIIQQAQIAFARHLQGQGDALQDMGEEGRTGTLGGFEPISSLSQKTAIFSRCSAGLCALRMAVSEA